MLCVEWERQHRPKLGKVKEDAEKSQTSTPGQEMTLTLCQCDAVSRGDRSRNKERNQEGIAAPRWDEAG